jgi:hypothetical protein
MFEKSACKVCNKRVAPAICPFCLSDEVESWLVISNYSLINSFKNEVQNYLKVINSDDRKLRCSVCGIETQHKTCVNCYTQHMHDWLKNQDIRVSEKFAETFKDFVTQESISISKV